ncbi:MAG: GspH/FimT family pseudopilin [Candidatus Methylumidiphilus sp.]
MKPSGPRLAQGVTLLELIFTLGIIVILLTIGIPAMTGFVGNIRLLAQANLLVADILHARSEAATRGRRTTLCASANVESAAEPTCATGTAAWTTGRIVFVDMNGNGQRNVTADAATHDVLLRKSSALEAGATLTATGFADTAHVSFSPFGGLLPTTAGSLTLCSPVMASGYQVAIAATGQPLSSKVACR